MKKYQITRDDVHSLTENLSKLSTSLPENQAALLQAIIGFAKDGLTHVSANFANKLGDQNLEDTGFVLSVPDKIDVNSVMSEAFKTKLPTGINDPISPFADSIGVSIGCVSWSKDYNKIIDPEQLAISNDVRIRGILSQIRDIKGGSYR